jgi:hypothetical protein
MFGLLEIEAGRVVITPAVQITNDKVRNLFAPKPEPVPDGIDILSAGKECSEFLSSIGLLEPILMTMAQQMAAAVASGRKPLTKKQWEAQVLNGGRPVIW